MITSRTLALVALCALSLLVFAPLPRVAAVEDELGAVPQLLREVVDGAVQRVKPALVRIAVVSTHYAEGRQQKFESFGSGVIVSQDGYVVTNHHVAGRALRLECTLASKERVGARLVGADPLTDIAVIQLEPREGGYPSAEWGDSSRVQVGDLVLAMGSPAALSQSVTLGIVSNTEMVMPDWLQQMGPLLQEGEDVGALVRWLGHDAAIAGGNSGGPLVDLAGRIVGINEISIGLSGAIPSNLARAVADELIAGGEVRRSWIGLSVQPRIGRNDRDTGALIANVMAGSPAERAGFQPGDVLLTLAGEPVDAAFAEQLPELNNRLASLPVGEPVQAMVARAAREYAITVVPVQRERLAPPETELRHWGATVRDLSFTLAQELRLPSRTGVLLTSMRPGGALGEARPPILPGDVLVSVNGKNVSDTAALQALTKTLLDEAGDRRVPVLAAVIREGEHILAATQVGPRDVYEPPRELQRAWLPLETQVVTRAIAEQLGQPDLKGFRVTRVYEEATQEKVGLRPGDLIAAVDGERLEATAPEDHEELAALIRQYKIGTIVELTVLRDGEAVAVPVRLLARPTPPTPSARYEDPLLEITISPLTFLERARQQWPREQQGVLVTDAQPGGWAAVANLRVGDLVTGINGLPVRNIDNYKSVTAKLIKQQPEYLAVRVLRGIYTQFLEIRPRWDAAAGAALEQE